MVTKKRRSRNAEPKQREVIGEAYLLSEVSREEKSEVFALLFKYRHYSSFKLRSKIASNMFADKPSALQSLATGAITNQEANRFV